MTDGLAEWILREDNGDITEKFEKLTNIHSQDEFFDCISIDFGIAFFEEIINDDRPLIWSEGIDDSELRPSFF